LQTAEFLTNLLGFNGVRELWAESDVGDRNVVQNNIKVGCSPGDLLANQTRDLDDHRYRQNTLSSRGKLSRRESDTHPLTLGDQLRGVELRDNAFQDLVDNRRQNTIIVIQSKRLVDPRQSIDIRFRQDTEGDVDHLQV
jgi:hypothetical protein